MLIIHPLYCPIGQGINNIELVEDALNMLHVFSVATRMIMVAIFTIGIIN